MCMWCLATAIAVRLLKESTASQDALHRLQQCARCADARAIVPARPAFEMRRYFAHLFAYWYLGNYSCCCT
jgi:hypothetical protein